MSMPKEERGPTAPADGDPRAGRLDSWKEIAVYLGRDVRTVQRWERREGLPIHTTTARQAGLGVHLSRRSRCVECSALTSRLMSQRESPLANPMR